MNAEQRMWSLVTLIMCATLVGLFAIMSDCSKHVADVEASPKQACIEAGGTWANFGAPNQVGRCYGAKK